VPVDVPVLVPVEVEPPVVPEVVPLVAEPHGPWLRLNWPLQLDAIIALALVTVEPRFRVVV
jgi:hypothetical protein